VLRFLKLLAAWGLATAVVLGVFLLLGALGWR
jgi:hypothetical protein